MYKDTVTVDCAVIGSGLAGLAAAVYASRAGLSVAKIGNTGGLAYTTGYLDFLGLSLSEESGYLAEPLEGIDTLRAERPEHPYARLGNEEIQAAFTDFLAVLEEAGLPYRGGQGQNLLALTPMGTIKPTYAVPATMMAGVEALASRTPCLMVDFAGLKAFSARAIAANIKPYWPDVTPVTVTFPDMPWTGELYAEAMARSLEVAANREALAEVIRPHLGSARCVGLPAILGIRNSFTACAHMSELLGVPVFEVPTLPPGIPGMRLRECVDEYLRSRGVELFTQRNVLTAEFDGKGFTLRVDTLSPPHTVRASQVILAGGRFLGGGLVADREAVREPLFNLPVRFPADRDMWHAEDYFAPFGHGINRAGLVVDAHFRPVDTDGATCCPNLFTAGAILAGQDWIREKAGAGIALASAHKAVSASLALRS